MANLAAAQQQLLKGGPLVGTSLLNGTALLPVPNTNNSVMVVASTSALPVAPQLAPVDPNGRWHNSRYWSCYLIVINVVH